MAAKATTRPRSNKTARVLGSLMAETNGGGSPENVPGFNVFRAATAGFDTSYVSGPTVLNARPDGGFYSSDSMVSVGDAPAFAAKPENVIGADNRVRVNDTAMTPWRCICHLEVQYDRGPVGAGTGFFVGEDLIVTAAHVLVDRSYYGWEEPPRRATRVRVVPGRNGSLAPYGVFVCDVPCHDPENDDCMIPGIWMEIGRGKEDEAHRFDYAAIRIPDRVQKAHLGKRLGYFGVKDVLSEDGFDGDMLFVNTAGFPQTPDKPYGTLWYNAGRTSAFDDCFVEYMVDTEGGQSGSPIYFYDKKQDQRYVIAIHTTGDFFNRGVLISGQIFDDIKRWAKR